MVNSPEEYFKTQDFSPSPKQAEYTPAERLFMMKYLGLKEEDLMGKGIRSEPEAPVQAVPEHTTPGLPADPAEYIENLSFDADAAVSGNDEAPAFIEKALESNIAPDEFPDDVQGRNTPEVLETAPKAAPEMEDGSAEPAPEAAFSDVSEAEIEEAETLGVMEAEPETDVPFVSEPALEVDAELGAGPEPDVAEKVIEPMAEAPEKAAGQESVSEPGVLPGSSSDTLEAVPETTSSVDSEQAPESTPEAVAAPVAPAPAPQPVEKAPEPASVPSAPTQPQADAKQPDVKSAIPPAAERVVRSSLDMTREEFEEVKAAEPALENILKQEEFCQMVAFFIGDQEFVIPTMAMQEVIRFETPIKIPMAPPFVEGVISLRGRVTPVVNLRDMLAVVNKPLEDSNKCIIICLRRGIQLGFVVEKIHTMYRVPQFDLEWAVEAQLGINSDVDFISAVMKSEDGSMLMGMLSVDKIIDFILR